MPNFSEELQTNNVLTRRILQMKVDKGFAMSKEEAEKNMQMNMKNFKTNVSKNLVSNQVRQDDMIAGISLGDTGLGKFKTNQTQLKQIDSTATQNTGNLLDLDSPAPLEKQQDSQ